MAVARDFSEAADGSLAHAAARGRYHRGANSQSRRRLRNVHVEATKAAVCQETPGVAAAYSPRTPGIASLSEDNCDPRRMSGRTAMPC